MFGLKTPDWLTRAVVCAVCGLATAAVFTSASSATPPGTTPVPFGVLQCSLQNGVRFCPGNGTTTRVPSWDGIPLDVDVTLPPPTAGNGPFPTLVIQHGWGGDKTEEEHAGSADDPRYDNVFFAQQGYAVVNYSARGFGRSCGPASAPAGATPSGVCAQGFSRVGDTRFEARDTQYLLGLLVDEGIARASALGVTGYSYGAGRSVELAYLRNRIRCAGAYDAFAGDPCRGRSDGSFVPWRSPGGTPLSIAASWPRWPWSDLSYALVPNGRFLDYDLATDGMDGTIGSHSPLGVPIASLDTLLYKLSGFIEPPAPTGAPPWDITTDYNVLVKGDVHSRAAQYIVDEWSAHHQGFGIPGTPAPLLIEQGFDDELFPIGHALRVYNDVRQHHPHGFVAIQTGDVGHPRATDKPRIVQFDDGQGLAFLNARLRHRRGGPRAGEVTAFGLTCPSTGPGAPPDAGPYVAPSWAALHPGVVAARSSGVQRVAPDSGDPALGALFDPAAFFFDAARTACMTTRAAHVPGTAEYLMPSRGFTLMGLPTIVARISTSGGSEPGQLDARLWDLSPGGAQLLVSRGVYRLTRTGTSRIVFQLNGGGYRFAAGHAVKLELLGADAPYYRPSPDGPTVTVSSLELVLPTRERPNGRQIVSPRRWPLPAPGERGPVTTQGVRVKRR